MGEELSQRGMVHQASSPDLWSHLRAGRVTGYVGFDPTAESLHVGSLMPVVALARLQRAGHRPIAVVGGGTGLIGDPSGKQSERTMLSSEKLKENLAGLRRQLERFLNFDSTDGTAAILVDNSDWLGPLHLLDFLRDVGKHFSVNAMIARDSVKTRLEGREQGISYTEFSYMLLQAYDFLALHDRFGCTLQMGGSDQWGNIVSGIDLVRRVRGAETYGLTFPLITRADGQKFGKSEKGNVWLDPALTSPYDFYQFWLNTSDDDVERYLLFLTLLSANTVRETLEASRANPGARLAQRTLAESVTTFVHGKDALIRAQRTTEVLFQGGDWLSLTPEDLADAFRNAPATELPRAALDTPACGLVGLLADSGLYPSRSQARTGVTNGGVSVNNVTVTDPARIISSADLLPGGFVVLRKGRKHYHVLRLGA